MHPWKHDKICPLYRAPEAGEDTEPSPEDDESELTSLIRIESKCGCKIGDHSHGKRKMHPWKHDKSCPLYRAPEAGEDIEPAPEDDELELTSLIRIESKCGCKIGDHSHGKRKMHPWKHDKSCPLYRAPQAGEDIEPEPEDDDVELTSSVMIRSYCACEKHDAHQKVKPHEHDSDCHHYKVACCCHCYQVFTNCVGRPGIEPTRHV